MEKVAVLSYAAGIVDGEGHISIQRNRINGSINFQALVIVTNTDAKLIDWLLEKFEGAFYFKKYQERRTVFKWYLGGPKACAFVESILPYLVIKKEQAETMLALGRLKIKYDVRSGAIAALEYKEEANVLKEAMLILNEGGK